MELSMDFFAYLGSSSDSGIFAARYSSDSGTLVPIGQVAEIDSPSFLAIHPNSRYVYAVSEVSQFEDQPSGGVVAYQVVPTTGKLQEINTRASGGLGPCHIALDGHARMAAIANYGDGSITTFRLQPEDGSIGARTSFFENEGSSINLERQTSAHAHGCFFSSDTKLLVTADLGLDRLYLYAPDVSDSSLTPEKIRWVNTTPGSGPRHFAFHPNGRDGYAINELDSTITRYSVTRGETRLTMQETISTLEENFHGTNTAAEIAIDKTGRFLYCSNRGADEIVVFMVAASGTLNLLQRIPSGGKTPRHFALDRDGSHVIVSNQGSDMAAVFRRDATTGRLSGPLATITLPEPTCVVLACRACLE
jgi:6-phosphogluconolactonase